MADDAPLLRACVLRFVDQHVIDAAVELVVHPGRRDARQQFMRLVDLILEIEQPAAVLFRAEAVEDRFGDRDERHGAVARGHGAPPLDQRPDAVAFFMQPFAQAAVLVLDVAGKDILALSGRFCAENLDIAVDLPGPAEAGERRKTLGLIAVRLLAGGADRGDGRPFRRRNMAFAEKFGRYFFFAIVDGNIEGAR